MSSGEADVAERTRAFLARSRSLDAFTRCRTDGCEVMVHLAGDEARCHYHGGRDDNPEYLTSTHDGSFIWTRRMVVLPPEDCE